MDLETLAADLITAKTVEKEAKAARLELEEAIATQVAKKDEGTDKATAGRFEVTVTSKLARALDYDSYRAIEEGLPVQCVDLKPSLNLKNMRILEAIDPDLVATFITTKPAKATVKVEVAQ